MQRAVALQDLAVDPGPFLPVGGARRHDVPERAVHGHLEPARPDDAEQTALRVEPFERQDAPRIGRIPSDLAVIHRHREEPGLVGGDEQRRREHARFRTG